MVPPADFDAAFFSGFLGTGLIWGLSGVSLFVTRWAETLP